MVDRRKATGTMENRGAKVFDSTRLDAYKRARAYPVDAASREHTVVPYVGADPFTFLPRTRENSIFRQTPIGNVKRSKEF